MKILRLLAILFPISVFAGDISYEFVIDLSGSMNRYQQGAALKSHAIKALSAALPEGRPYAIRVFGHRVGLQDRDTGCTDTELIFPFDSHDISLVRARLSQLSAQGFTPLATSLRAVEEDLFKTSGKRVVILLSDGIDSCDGDPAHEIEQLKAHGLDIIVNPIGLGLDAAASAQLQQLASLTGGKFAAVSNPSLLSQAFFEALKHIEGSAKSRPFPEDAGAGKDAGGSAKEALQIRKGDWLSGSIGSQRGASRDESDYFALQSTAGGKFILQIEALTGNLLSATVLDGDGIVLGVASKSSSESEPIMAPQGGQIFVRFDTKDTQEVRYRFKIIPLVEIDE